MKWNDPSKTPLPPNGTRVLVYRPDFDAESWPYGIEVGIVRANDEGFMAPYVDTLSAFHCEGTPGWRWAFAPELPKIPQEG